MEIFALNVSFFLWCFHGVILWRFFLKKRGSFVPMLNALHLYPLERLAPDSILQYHPFRVCRFRKSALFWYAIIRTLSTSLYVLVHFKGNLIIITTNKAQYHLQFFVLASTCKEIFDHNMWVNNSLITK